MAEGKLKLAKHIDMNTETGVLTIDGEPLGYYLADDTVTVTVDRGAPRKISIALLAEHVTITPTATQGPLSAPTEHDHKPVQHRDGREPWCNQCGMTADGTKPQSRLDKG